MMALRRLTVTNYQSIAYARLELGDWTSLVGTSDVGKSAILRAFWSLLTNSRGDFFIRQGADWCEVAVERADGLEIVWRKARGKSGSYRVGGATFDRTAGEVPDAVAAALPLFADVQGEQLAPGIQRQHDRPFLFADTARRRAEILGTFDGTNVLLLAETDLRRRQRSAQGLVSSHESRLEGLTRDHADLAYVEELGEAVKAAEAAQEARQQAEARVEALRALLRQYEAVVATVDRLRAILGAAAMWLSKAGDLAWQAKEKRWEVERVTVIIEGLSRPEVVLPEIPDFALVEAAWDRVTDGRVILAALEGIQRGIPEIEEQLYDVNVQLTEIAVCPTCGRPLNAPAL